MNEIFGKRRATRTCPWGRLVPLGRLGALVFRHEPTRRNHNGLAALSTNQDPDSRIVRLFADATPLETVFPENLIPSRAGRQRRAPPPPPWLTFLCGYPNHLLALNPQ